MDVHVVGEDPVREEVAAALDDVDIGVRAAGVSDIEDAGFAVVADVAGSDRFAYANRAAKDGETPWIAVEVGGVGGVTISSVDAAVSGFGPDTGCYECLNARVRSTHAAYTTTADPRGARPTVRLAGAIAGRECVRYFEDAAVSLLGSVIELPHARRQFMPVPGCRCQSEGRDRSIDLADEATPSLDETVDAMDRAIDDRVGLVRSIGETDSYPAPYYLATMADTEAYSESAAPANAAGVDEDWNRAFVKAVGEGLERYCAGVYRTADLVEAPGETLDAVVEPDAFVRPDDAPAADPSATQAWVEGRNLTSDTPTHLPADAVHLPQPGPGLVPQITTGLGLGSSMSDALVAGLTEVIERDATMLSWYSSFEPLALQIQDDAFERFRRRVASEGLSVTPLLVTQDIDVPVVSVAVHRDDSAWPAFAIGSAADLDVRAAARDALAEATQNWMELRSIGAEDAREASAWIGEYGRFPDAAREFVDAERTVDGASVGPSDVPEGAEAVDALIDRVADAGYDVYGARVTTRDVAELGFEAVRVLVPEAQPLFTSEPYFGDRARTVPTELGFEARLDREPHPYP